MLMKTLQFTCKTLVLLLAVVVVSSCQSTDKIKFKRIDQVEIDQFNASLQKVEIKDLEELARLYLPDDPYAEGNYKYTTSVEENKGKTILTIREEGINDDSIEGKLVKLTVEKKENSWHILQIEEAHRCWSGRGHQDWSPEPCQ